MGPRCTLVGIKPDAKKISRRTTRPPTPVPTANGKLLRSLRPVPRPSTMPIRDSRGIERAADDVVTNTGKVLHAAPAHQHDRVLLQVVPFAGDVGVDFAAIGQAHASYLAQRRIRLLGCRGKDAQTHTAPLGGAHQVGGFGSRLLALTSPTNELLDRRHIGVPSKLSYRSPGSHPNAHRARMHHPPVSYFRRQRGRRNRSSGVSHVLPEAELRQAVGAKNRCILASFRPLSTLERAEEQAQIGPGFGFHVGFRFGVQFGPRIASQVFKSEGVDPAEAISPSVEMAGASAGTGSSASGSSSGPSISSSGASTWIPIWW